MQQASQNHFLKFLCGVLTGLFLLWSATPGIGAAGSTYYVATNGDNSRSCAQAQDELTPKRTINAALGCVGTPLGAGANVTVIVKAGTYEEEQFYNLPGGTSWSAPFTLKANPGDLVILYPPVGAYRVFTIVSPSQYAIIDGFVMDAARVTYEAVKINYWGTDPVNSAHHIRIQNSEIKGAPVSGIFVTSNSPGNEFINVKVHDNGATDFDHGIYLRSNENLVENCEFYRNAGWGIHKYPEGDNNIIRNNRIYDNARVGNRGPGIGIYGGQGNYIYNNLVFRNNIGISVEYGEMNSHFYNNTIYSNDNAGIFNGLQSTNATFKNNILYQNGSGLTDRGSGTSVSNNLVGTNPRFVNATGGDFRLRAGSPAIDAGVMIPEVATDIDGVSRPRGSSYDIGAYESPPRAPAGVYLLLLLSEGIH